MELVWQALGFDGLPLLIIAVMIAGLVRGFSGFGAALIFVPLAALVLQPVWVIVVLLIFDSIGPMSMLRRAWREGEPKDVGLLGLGALLGMPVGFYLLTKMSPELFRWLVCLMSFAMLAALAGGWRYRNPLNEAMTIFVGTISGVLQGVAGLPGPPVILSYLSSPRNPAVVRANTMMYLVLVDLMALGVLAIKGLLALFPVLIGIVLVPPYTLSALIGQRIFKPDRVRFYRIVASAVIAASAIAGLPVWE